MKVAERSEKLGAWRWALLALASVLTPLVTACDIPFIPFI